MSNYRSRRLLPTWGIFKLPIIFMFLGTAFQEVAALPFLFDPSWTLGGLACTSLLPAPAGTALSVKQNCYKPKHQLKICSGRSGVKFGV